jgi:CDP-diacylglycerol--glycerol-3-phosphate 3-phosphatidyltransferase
MITWGRIAAIPLVVWFLTKDNEQFGFWASVVFIIASISDFIDGYLARLFNVETMLGQFLDPVADKLLVTAALVMLIPLQRVSAILVVLLLSRELLINGLRAVAAGNNLTIGAGWTGKWKTGAQMVAIPCLMLNRTLLGLNVLLIGQVLLWIALVLSLISAFDYMSVFFNKFDSDKKPD